MEMSLSQYVLNPALKTNAILNASAREIIKRLYESKFDNILLREGGKITYYLFSQADKNIYWAYIKVPSEVVHNFYYDVIFKFTPTSSTGFLTDLFKFNVQFFSNDPNFMYTYAYVFNKNDLLIQELRSKLPKEALTKAPEEKNPTEQISYEKAIYFAYLVMKDRGLNKLIKFKGESQPLDPKFLVTNVMPAEEKVNLREEEGKRYSGKKKTVISKNAANAMLNKMSSNGRRNLDLSTSNVRTTANVKKVGSIKRANNIKTTKTTTKK